jgi:phosphoesterase RecJ-like protein
MLTKTDFDNAIDLIRKSERILLATHTKPDGDACGCLAAIADLLTRQGRALTALTPTPAPEWYDFLFTRKPLALARDITLETLGQQQFDLVLILDTNSRIQLGRFAEYLEHNSAPVLVIDHHATADALGTLELTDPTAAATALIIFDLLSHARWPLTPEIARALFVAVATDTGWFQFANTDARAYRSCAELIDAGADPTKLYDALYNTFSVPRFDLMCAMLATLELHLDDRFATLHITRSHFQRTGASLTDTENLINESHRIATVRASALFVELNDGRIRCSLRSKSDLDVAKIAQKFGGGGHRMAAGTFLPGPLENAKRLILDEVTAHFQPPENP